MSDNKDRKILKRVIESISDLRQFITDYYNVVIDDLNFSLSSLSLTRNFNSQYIEDISMPATNTIRVYHRLNQIPSYKLVVKQSGGGLITDGVFNKNYIELYNAGATTAIISIILFRE